MTGLSRKQLHLSILLTLVWLVFLSLFSVKPFWSLRPDLHDHISNLHVPILAWHRGLEIYTAPIQQTLANDSSAEAMAVATKWAWPLGEMFHLPERGNSNPLMIVWGNLPRPYPPGIYLLLAPLAYFMEMLGGFSESILLFLTALLCFGAHIVFFQLVNGFSKAFDEKTLAWYHRLIFATLYLEVVGWSLSGQYEAIGLLFLISALTAVNEKKYLSSMSYFCLAVFMHFRGILWALPLLVVWIRNFEVIRKDIIALSFFKKLGVLLVALLGMISGVIFIKVSPALLHSTPMTNVFAHNLLAGRWGLNHWVFFPLLASIVYYYWRQRETMLLLALLNILVLFTTANFLQPWYALYLFPLIFAFKPLNHKRMSLGVRYLTIVCIGATYLHSAPTELYFVKQVGKLILVKVSG